MHAAMLTDTGLKDFHADRRICVTGVEPSVLLFMVVHAMPKEEVEDTINIVNFHNHHLILGIVTCLLTNRTCTLLCSNALRAA
jgi:hypothetical protein